MSARRRIAKKPGPWRTGHRPLSWAFSVMLHGGLIGFAFLPPDQDRGQRESFYRSVVVPLEKEHKVIWYDFRTPLPEVSAANATAGITSPLPNELKTKQRIVAAPNEKNGKQLVWIPAPKVKLQVDLKAPNLIAIEPPIQAPVLERPKPKAFQAPELPKTKPQTAPLPSAPAIASLASDKQSVEVGALLHKPVAAPVRAFIAPKEEKTAPRPVTALPNAPAIDGLANEKQSAEVSELLHKPGAGPVRAFNAPKEAKVPPPAVTSLPSAPAIASVAGEKQSAEVSELLRKPGAGPVRAFTAPKEAKAAAVPTTALPNAPAVGGVTGDKPSTEISALLNRPVAGPPPKPFTAPPGTNGSTTAPPTVSLPAAPSLTEAGGAQAATIAIIGLSPANVPQIPTPEGSRPARIMAGDPVPGATRAELGGGNGPLTVPDLSIEGSTSNSPARASRSPLELRPSSPATGLAVPQLPQVLPTTARVSVAQWPNTRNLPAAVEHHFQNRVVYMTVLPGTQSDGDWVVWYGEAAVTPPDSRVLMRPPVLLHSVGLPPIPAHSDHGTGRIRVMGVIHQNGHLDSLNDLAGIGIARDLADALQSWQFSPATRNGVAFDADAVIEIPVQYGALSLR